MHSLLPLLQSSVKLLREKLVNTEKYLIIGLEPMGLGTFVNFEKKTDDRSRLHPRIGIVKRKSRSLNEMTVVSTLTGQCPISFLCCLTLEIWNIFNFETRHKFQVRNFISDYKTFGSITIFQYEMD